MPTQCAVPLESVNEYQWKLRSKRAYHAMHKLRIYGLSTLFSSSWGLQETEISPTLWAHEAWEEPLLIYCALWISSFVGVV